MTLKSKRECSLDKSHKQAVLYIVARVIRLNSNRKKMNDPSCSTLSKAYPTRSYFLTSENNGDKEIDQNSIVEWINCPTNANETTWKLGQPIIVCFFFQQRITIHNISQVNTTVHNEVNKNGKTCDNTAPTGTATAKPGIILNTVFLFVCFFPFGLNHAHRMMKSNGSMDTNELTRSNSRI